MTFASIDQSENFFRPILCKFHVNPRSVRNMRAPYETRVIPTSTTISDVSFAGDLRKRLGALRFGRRHAPSP